MSLGTKKDWELKQKCGCAQCPYCHAPMKHTGPPPPPPPPKPERKPAKEPNRPEWLVHKTHGLEGGDKYDCLYEGKSWAIIKEPGSMYWSGLGCQSYGRTKFEVWRKDGEAWGRGGWFDAADHLAQGKHLHEVTKTFGFNDARVERFECHQGRMNKKLMAKLIEEVDLLDKERP